MSFGSLPQSLTPQRESLLVHVFNSNRVKGWGLVGPYRFLFAFAVVLSSLLSPLAHSELAYEIAVFTDDLVAPGELGTQLHLNTTPQGLSVPSYSGEVMNVHGQRLTPDFSYGLSRTVEAGLMLPMTRTNRGGVQSTLKVFTRSDFIRRRCICRAQYGVGPTQARV